MKLFKPVWIFLILFAFVSLQSAFADHDGSGSGGSCTCSLSSSGCCNTEALCSGVGGQWTTSSGGGSGWCQTPCGPGNVWSCYTESDCSGAGGSWSISTGGGSGWCQEKCSAAYTSGCKTQSECTGIGGKWEAYQGTTSGDGQTGWCQQGCSTTNTWSCDTEPLCTGVGGQWVKDSYEDPASKTGGYRCQQGCSASNLWTCDEAGCNRNGGTWYGWDPSSDPTGKNGNCEEKCGKSNVYSCRDATSCSSAGGQWKAYEGYAGYGNYATGSCEPGCNVDNPWSCRDQTTCTALNTKDEKVAVWCANPPSYSCPECSKASDIYYSEGYCTDVRNNPEYACPDYSCSDTNPYNCTDRTTCESLNTGKEKPVAVWCDNTFQSVSSYSPAGYCNSLLYNEGFTCPSCNAEEPWNCGTEETCNALTSAGEKPQAHWCVDPYTYTFDGSKQGKCQRDECPSCNETYLGHCTDQASCERVSISYTGKNAEWCGDYCSSSCPSCSADQYWNCRKSEEQCVNLTTEAPEKEFYWCTGPPNASGTQSYDCRTEPCRECNSDDRNSCYDKRSCEGADGFWCEYGYGYAWCAGSESQCGGSGNTCSAGFPAGCTDKQSCSGINYEWCHQDSRCYKTTAACGEICDEENIAGCTTRQKCDRISSLNWCQLFANQNVGVCQSESCPTCSIDYPESCSTEQACTDKTGFNWCGTGIEAVCQSAACGEDTCTKLGGSFCPLGSDCSGDRKNSSDFGDSCCVGTCTEIKNPTCSDQGGVICKTDETCWASSGSRVGRGITASDTSYCCLGRCSSVISGSCSITNLPECAEWECNPEILGEGATVEWCPLKSACVTRGTCPQCNYENPENCVTQESCELREGYWCGNTCNRFPCQECGEETYSACTTQTACTELNVGKNYEAFYWCKQGAYTDSFACQNYPCTNYSCSETNKWACIRESDCVNPEQGNGEWCGPRDCRDHCPVCSDEAPWECRNQADCKANTDRVWCASPAGPASTFSTGSNGTCYAPGHECADYSCKSNQIWYCDKESTCTKNGGNWCVNTGDYQYSYCTEFECPVCNSLEYNAGNCGGQTLCEEAGHSWCQTPGSTTAFGTSGYCTSNPEYCTDYTCNAREGNAVNCTSKGKAVCESNGWSWCGTTENGYCSDSCPQCNEKRKQNCFTSDSCTLNGGTWCQQGSGQGDCREQAVCPTCDPFNLMWCTTQTACENQGAGYWCPNGQGSIGCSATPCTVCSLASPEGCLTQATCTESEGLFWHQFSFGTGQCSVTPLLSTCGNGTCEPEEENTCKRDCFKNVDRAVCGNNVCERSSGENATVCSEDCKEQREVCGNNICGKSSGETFKTCPSDCAPLTPCGDGVCVDGLEDATTCSIDCQPRAYCGNGLCELNENRSTCATDCFQGTCGDGICGRGESKSSCENDCGFVIEAPATCGSPDLLQESWDRCENLSDYRPVFEQTSGDGCPSVRCEPIEQSRTPSACQPVTNSDGFTTYTCTDYACPVYIVDPAEACERAGGDPLPAYRDAFGCFITDCDFGNEPDETVTLFDECPPPEKQRLIAAQCNAEGLVVTEVVNPLNSCVRIKCVQPTPETTRPVCQPLSLGDVRAKESSCNGTLVRNFNENGCAELDCVPESAPETSCKQPPSEVFASCAERGGQYIVRTGANGCAEFAACVGAEEQTQALTITQIPNPTVINALLGDLETLTEELNEMSAEARAVSVYWRNGGETEQGERFERISFTVESSRTAVQTISSEIVNKETITVDFLNEKKSELQRVKRTLQESLTVLLGVEKDQTNCEGKGECFEQGLRTCKVGTEITFTKAVGRFVVRLEALTENGCEFSVRLIPTIGQDLTMSCTAPDYALGHFNPNRFTKICEGNLVSSIAGILNTTPSNNQQLPPGCKEIIDEDGSVLVACPVRAAPQFTIPFNPTGFSVFGVNWR